MAGFTVPTNVLNLPDDRLVRSVAAKSIASANRETDMTQNPDARIYEIEINYRDAGLELKFQASDWRDMVEEIYTSFEVIQRTFRTDEEEHKEHLREKFEEIQPGENSDGEVNGPAFQIKNPPQEWVDDPAEIAEIHDMLNMLLARMGLFALMKKEKEAQQNLLENDQYKAALVRQSAFFEEYLTFSSQIALQKQKDDVLSSKEISIIKNMGHKNRIRLAHLLGEIDEEDHALLQEMAKRRNDVAHTAWSDFSSQEESQIRSIAQRIRELLERYIEEAEENIGEGNDIQPVEASIGFEALPPDLQLLQIAIVTALNTRGGTATVDQLREIVPGDPDEVEDRCGHMEAVGYLEMDEGMVILTDDGREFYEDKVP